MRPDRLTTSAQGALASAQTAASGANHPEVGGLHLLAALLEDKSGPADAIIKRAGIEPMRLRQIVDAELSRLPTTSSGRGALAAS